MATQLSLQENRHILLDLIHQWDRRLRLQHTVFWLPRALMPGLALGIALAAVSRLHPFLLPDQIALVTIAALLLGLLVGGLIIWFARRSPLVIARRFDIMLNLDERISTALELLEGRIRASDELVALQIDDARLQARSARVREHLPFRSRPRDWGIVLALVAVLAVLLILPNPQAELIAQNAEQTAAIEEAEETLRQITEDVAADASLSNPEREALLEVLETSTETLQQENITPEEAFAAISDVQSALQNQANLFNQRVNNSQSALDAAADAMSEFSGGDAQQQESMEELLSALQNLAQSMQNMTPEERQQAAQQMNSAAQSMSNSSPEAAQAMQQAAQSLQNGDTQNAQQQLQQASESLQQSAQQQSQQQQAAQQMSQQAQNAQQAAQQISEAAEQQSSQNQQQSQQQQQSQSQQSQQQGQEQSQQSQQGNQQSQSQQSQSGQQTGQQENQQQGQNSSQQSQPGEASQQQGEGEGQQSNQEAQNGQQMQDSSAQSQQQESNNAMSGAAVSSGSGDSASDQNSMNQQNQSANQQQDQNNNPDGEGERDYEPIYAPQNIGGENNNGEEIVLEPDGSGAPVIEDNFTENPTGNTTVPYNQVYSSYQNAANQALDSGYVPLGLKDIVRDYFTSLEPGS